MRYVIAPGYEGSDAGHWQSLWQAELGESAVRVQPSSWVEPELEDWVSALDRAATPGAVIVAHSLGCLTALEWLARRRGVVAGVFLVAVPDPEQPDFPAAISGFSRPSARAGVPTLMVASTDDPYSALHVSRDVAAVVGAELVVVEGGQHLSTASGRGPWPEGRDLLARFVARL